MHLKIKEAGRQILNSSQSDAITEGLMILYKFVVDEHSGHEVINRRALYRKNRKFQSILWNSVSSQWGRSLLVLSLVIVAASNAFGQVRHSQFMTLAFTSPILTCSAPQRFQLKCTGFSRLSPSLFSRSDAKCNFKHRQITKSLTSLNVSLRSSRNTKHASTATVLHVQKNATIIKDVGVEGIGDPQNWASSILSKGFTDYETSISFKKSQHASCDLFNDAKTVESVFLPNINFTSLSHKQKRASSDATKNVQGHDRRAVLVGALTLASAAAGSISAASANVEVDKQSGQLFAPKAVMLGGGGSDEARGVSLNVRDRSLEAGEKRPLSRSEGQIQTVYETRFIAYLSRFLLTYDGAAKSWWEQDKSSSSSDRALRFAQFAESVEVGLADYFVGPYGSYASVSAARAGIDAQRPARSSLPDGSNKRNVVQSLFKSLSNDSTTKKTKKKPLSQQETEKQGVLNLLALLQARYRSPEEKLQLAILFSLISDPTLQPTAQITSLLGEADNGSLESVRINKDADLRGYTENPVTVQVDVPPALGDDFIAAKVTALTRPSSRILRIDVIDGGSGYTSAPKVTVSLPTGESRVPCEAVSTIDRNGRVDSIFITNPGHGYGGWGSVPTQPVVKVAAPGKKGNKDLKSRPCVAVAELEYEIYDISVSERGNGYVVSEPPKINIQPPEERDWTITYSQETTQVTSVVQNADGRQFYPFEDVSLAMLNNLRSAPTKLLPPTVRPIRQQLIPGVWTASAGDDRAGPYYIPGMPSVPARIELPSSQYAAYDPILGGVGISPVTKGALSLSASQYARLALSGAICTVVVRTMLNPLELIKTKIQLQNDLELLNFVQNANKLATSSESKASKLTPAKISDTAKVVPRTSQEVALVAKDTFREASSLKIATVRQETMQREKYELEQSSEDKQHSNSAVAMSQTKKTNEDLTTVSLAKGLVELRGPLSLFQSADITLLASLVFGGLGFGATELFRRFFTSLFFEVGGDGQTEVILLIAAALATILTAFAATPFELLRVRSMGMVEGKPWRDVLTDFLAEKREERLRQSYKAGNPTATLSLQSVSKLSIAKQGAEALFKPFPKIVSRELPFALAKFLAFDLVAKSLESVVNSYNDGSTAIQVGVGAEGLAISAFSGAVAGLAGAFVSHPADLVLTLTSAASKKQDSENEEGDGNPVQWQDIVRGLIEKEGGFKNLFAGLPARMLFFFLVIGLQFFLYDYVKTLLSVGSDDLSLVLDVFYAVRQGLVEVSAN